MRETIPPAAVPTGSSRHPRFSVSQVSTLAASFADDVATYAQAGLDGIGIWELKLGDGADARRSSLLDRSGLGRAVAVPAVPSILPLPLLPGPADPRERIDAYRASIRRLARVPAGRPRVPDRAGGRPGAGRGAPHRRRRAPRVGGGGRAGRPPHRARAVPARGHGELVAGEHDLGRGRADRGGRLAGGRDPVRRLASLEHARPARRHRARGAPLRRRPHQRLPRRRPAASPTGCCPATASPTSRRSCVRSTAQAGAATTTSRSFPTTERGEPSTPMRSGTSLRPSWSPGPGRRSTRCGRLQPLLDCPCPDTTNVPVPPSVAFAAAEIEGVADETTEFPYGAHPARRRACRRGSRGHSRRADEVRPRVADHHRLGVRRLEGGPDGAVRRPGARAPRRSGSRR